MSKSSTSTHESGSSQSWTELGNYKDCFQGKRRRKGREDTLRVLSNRNSRQINCLIERIIDVSWRERKNEKGRETIVKEKGVRQSEMQSANEAAERG